MCKMTGEKGVPQGTVLGPLLFNLYANDIDTQANPKIVQYADDTVLISRNHKIDDGVIVLENCIIKMIEYFNIHSLKMNPDKTDFMVFGNHCVQKQLIIKDQVIREVKEVKYLCVIMDNKFRYDSHVKQILSKMAQGIRAIYTLRNPLPLHLRLSILNTLVLSHIQYSAILLSTISNNLIRTLEKQLGWVVKASFHCAKCITQRN